MIDFNEELAKFKPVLEAESVAEELEKGETSDTLELLKALADVR